MCSFIFCNLKRTCFGGGLKKIVWVIVCVCVCTFSHSGGTRASYMQLKVSSKLGDITTKPLIPFSSSTRDELAQKHTQLQQQICHFYCRVFSSHWFLLWIHWSYHALGHNGIKQPGWLLSAVYLFYVGTNALFICLGCSCQNICVK